LNGIIKFVAVTNGNTMNKTIKELSEDKKHLEERISSLFKDFINEHGGDDLLRVSAACVYAPRFGDQSDRFLNFAIDVTILCPV
jgi:hypothetical protein